jgi:hypothetical protein
MQSQRHRTEDPSPSPSTPLETLPSSPSLLPCLGSFLPCAPSFFFVRSFLSSLPSWSDRSNYWSQGRARCFSSPMSYLASLFLPFVFSLSSLLMTTLFPQPIGFTVQCRRYTGRYYHVTTTAMYGSGSVIVVITFLLDFDHYITIPPRSSKCRLGALVSPRTKKS